MKQQFLLAPFLFVTILAFCLPCTKAQNNQLPLGNTPAMQHQFVGKTVGIHTVNLSWKPASESGILSFELQRSTDSINFTPVLLMQAKGAIKKPNGYTYTDTELPTTRYFYRLCTQNFNGQETYSPILQVDLKDGDASLAEVVQL